ncbi:unnamed protein product [Meloidogyne enterolobii]|uniref:Uncharacterized protein n=1 Tax=Meloidogyne enterolobii TaxID=390850 RepID=A0ACB0YAF7_MELEN
MEIRPTLVPIEKFFETNDPIFVKQIKNDEEEFGFFGDILQRLVRQKQKIV